MRWPWNPEPSPAEKRVEEAAEHLDQALDELTEQILQLEQMVKTGRKRA